MHQGWILPLFVPGTRPDRFAKAAASGTDAIIVDLEDAVDPGDKEVARQGARLARGFGVDVILRVNACGTDWHEDDLALASQAADAVMLAKAQSPAELAEVHARTGLPVVALVETVAALDKLPDLAMTAGVVQLAFGTMDLAAELRCEVSARHLDTVRLALLVASAKAGISPPLDGVSLSLGDAELLRTEARNIAQNGFAGRMMVHPAQVAPSAQGLAPSEAQVDQARRILASKGAADRVDGRMVDAPVRRSAEILIARADRCARIFGSGKT